jgi:hypothetical protein
MALPLALLGLVVISALLASGFVSALLEQRIGRNAMYTVQAAAAAEAGLAATVAEWDQTRLGLLAPSDTAVLAGSTLPGSVEYFPAVIRLNPQLYLVRVIGFRRNRAGGELARREVGLIVRAADSAAAGPPIRPLRNRAWLPGG